MAKRSTELKPEMASRKNLFFILDMFALIGITFPSEGNSLFKSCIKKIFFVYYNLYALYFIALTAFHHTSIESLSDGENLMNIFYFIILTILRLHLMIHRNSIVDVVVEELVNSNPVNTSNPQRHFKAWIILYFCANLFLSVGVSFKEYFETYNSTYLKDTYYLFGQRASYGNLMILTTVQFELTRNLYEFATPAMVLLLICYILKEMDSAIKTAKNKVTSGVSSIVFESKQVEELSSILCQTSNMVSRVNENITWPIFYLLILCISYVMLMISVIVRVQQPLSITATVFFLVTVAIILGLVVLGTLSERISKRYSELKAVIVTSSAVRHRISVGNCGSVGIIGVMQVMRELTDSFQVTAMGEVKVDKTLVVTILCSFITYGVILYQMMQK